MRTTAVAALTLTAALALGACQDEVTSASPSSTASSSASNTREGPSSASNPPSPHDACLEQDADVRRNGCERFGS